jgi:hypothetical protein
MNVKEERPKHAPPIVGAEEIERSIGSVVNQFASNVDTGAGLMAGGLVVKAAVDGVKSIVSGSKTNQQPKQ